MTDQEPGDLAGKTKEFVLDFLDLHIESGEPSYSTLAKATRRSKATISRVFKVDTLPKWEILEAMLKAYKCDEQTVTTWRRRWASIKRLSKPALAAREPAPPALQACEEPVEDLDEHVKQQHQGGDGRRLRAL